jgi:hypothetical protein
MANIVANIGKTFIMSTSTTPAKLATAIDCVVNMKFKDNAIESKLSQVALASIRVGKEISGEVEVEGDDAVAMEALLDGTRTSSSMQLVENEELTVPTTPFKVSPAGAADFVDDVGCYYKVTGVQLERYFGVSTPGAGQYAVDNDTGEYTFNSADAGLVIQVSYMKLDTTMGQHVSILNGAPVENTYYSLLLVNTFDGQTACKINKVVFGEMSPVFSQTVGERSKTRKIPFTAYAAAAGEVISWSAVTQAELDA